MADLYLAIMAPEIQPVLDTADHNLLLTPEQIRTRGASSTNVSFLRKTQYMTSGNTRANDPLMRSTSRSSKATKPTKATIPAISRDDPSYIKRYIEKGFNIAFPESAALANSTPDPLPLTTSDRLAWESPSHPSNSKMKPVAFYPLLPDLPAKTDSNSFISVKFDKPPLPVLPNGKRDNRIDVAILHPAKVDEVEREWKLRREAHEKNPDLYEDPGRLPYDWDFCVPRLEGSKGDKDIVEKIRRKLNPADPRRDDRDLYLNKEKGRFEYERIRTFAEDSAPMTHGWRYLALSLFDPDTVSSGAGDKEVHSRLKKSGQGRAAYYYEIGQRMRLKADRVKTLAQARAQGGQAGKVAAVANEYSVDGVDVLIREPDEDEVLMRAETRALVDRVFEGSKELRELRRRAEERDKERELNGVLATSGQPGPGGNGKVDADAEGDIDGTPNRRASRPVNGTTASGRGADTADADIEMADADADTDADGDIDDE